MAKTITQIQQMITDKYDAREVINEIADYLQANPSSPPSSSYLVYTALFSQAANLTSGVLVAGKVYTVTSLQAGDDFSNVGYIGLNINFVATGTTPADWSNGSTVVPAPESIILQNTLSGTPQILGISGDYNITLAGAFPENKILIPGFVSWQGDATTFVPISDGASIIGYYSIYWGSTDTVTIDIWDTLFNNIEYNSLIGQSFLSIEIRVYQ